MKIHLPYLPILFTLTLSLAACGSGEAEKSHGDEHGDEHADEDGEEHGGAQVRLSPKQIALAEIATEEVVRGAFPIEIQLTGEVSPNQHRLVHVVSRVSGVAREVRRSLGDQVRRGEVLTVIDSPELADARASYSSSREWVALKTAAFDRIERLFQEGVASEQVHLESRQELAEATIALRAAEQRLAALGLGHEQIKRLEGSPDEVLARYPITASMSGTIIERHITRGERVDDAEIFTIADLSTVWVLASVYEKDMAQVAEGQSASVRVGAFPDRSFPGKVTWVADTLEESTRTLKIRVEVDNADRLLKPGMFATLGLRVKELTGVQSVPLASLQRQKGQPILFVEVEEGVFERRAIVTGQRSFQNVEVLDGVRAGEKVVTAGSFLLRSEIEKASFEAGHGH